MDNDIPSEVSDDVLTDDNDSSLEDHLLWLNVASDPACFTILHFLYKSDFGLTFGELIDKTELSEDDLLYHLDALQTARLIHDWTHDVEKTYRIPPYYKINEVGRMVHKSVTYLLHREREYHFKDE
ncbi:hypothetical protein C457_13434 [Haloferax prahovense DSM 18310]|uniref:ArsR family transcriptional regulator n=1 Tax=Haloferax prahovense (strain DSM 18310 / JCM 13924 / TL6) TaxID=1227461 RepID=M0G699_HALPT|nr:hypothetical protein [Haloferax prahovense]ELZ67042.1 hypothetical protein C457_13434 [Haloferax prahovense DSM 18310]